MKNKYHNKITEVDGIKFHSLAEARRYKQLKILEIALKITDLQLQPKFLLQESFTYNKEKIRAIYYIADFAYFDIESSSHIVEDVKGVLTKEYILKKKLFLKKYGQDVNFYELK